MAASRFFILCLLLFTSLVTGILLAQDRVEDPPFTLIQQIGRTRPTGIRYDANFDQLAMVDTSGRLVLADAATFSTIHVLHQRGAFNAYTFSHDGRYLALALDRRVEVWDTQAGEINVTLEPEGVLGVTGPLVFSEDDRLLRFDSIVPEPAETRVSENDTSILPWVWDLAAAHREARSTLPRAAPAHAFFDFRHGFVLGPNRIVIGALPRRLQIIDVKSSDLPVINEITTPRNERDPISVWRSLNDDLLYVRPITQNTIVQIDTTNGSTFDFLPGQEMRQAAQIERFNALNLSNQARIIGEPLATTSVPLLELLLGADYRQSWDYRPVTVMLLDVLVPVTAAAGDRAFMIYTYDETRGVGTVDLIRVPDIMHLALHPDNKHLVIRRISRQQPIEIYDLDTGLLTRRIYPAIADPGGRNLFALNADGSVILSDFERFNTQTGEVLRQDLNHSTGFQDYYFSLDSRRLVTLRGDEWWVWDIATSEVIRKETVRLRGHVVDVSTDGHRFLTREDDHTGVFMEIVDVGAEIRKSVQIEIPSNSDNISEVIPSPDWTHFLVTYWSGNVAIYHIERGRLHYIVQDDLPANYDRFGWTDEHTAYVSSASGGGLGTRIYGVEYHASGLPTCLVTAYPDTWNELLPLWEWFNANLGGNALARLSLNICDRLPETTEALVDSLTPTPVPFYNVVATRPAYAVAGVPVCLTSRFPAQALTYADLWRDISAGLNEDEAAELGNMLCEGLLGSLGSVAATATPDPLDVAVELTSTAQALRDNPPTATLGPESTGTNVSVMLIDAETGIRSMGRYLPPQPTAPNMNLVTMAFQQSQGFTLQQPHLSPDGTLIAGINTTNHLVVYRLGRSYSDLAADATATIDARRTGEARQIALRPTATPTFAEIGTARPTITPTITPTSPPPPEQPYGDPAVSAFCTITQIHPLIAAPSGYNPAGTLLVSLPDSSLVWRLNPRTGDIHPDETLPRCINNNNCDFSFDQNWILHTQNDISVSRPDGSDRQVLFEPQEAPAFPESVFWLPQNVIEYFYTGYVDGQTTRLSRLYDPENATLSEPFERPGFVSINDLPSQAVAEQPGGSLLLARTIFNTGSGSGYNYYIYDHDTQTAEFFARVYSDLPYAWHPTGRALYYWLAGDENDRNGWQIYDAEQREHFHLGDSYSDGLWSRDGHHRVRWLPVDHHEWEGGPIPKLAVWDSETSATRVYCLPETGFTNLGGSPLLWSPDGRYIAFRNRPVSGGDSVLTPTPVTTATLTPTPTLSLEEQRMETFYRIYLLDLETATVVEINDESSSLLLWLNEETIP